MGSITTTSYGEPLKFPNQQFIDRENYDGDLWFAKRVSDTQVDIYKSNTNGVSWAATGATFTRTNLQEISGLFMDSSGNIHMAYRVYESGTDRIYYRRLPANSTTWDAEQFVVGASAGSAGAVYTGIDLVAFKISYTWYIHMAVGTQDGVNGGITMFSATLSSYGTFTMRNNLISGYRQWLNGPPGEVHPSLEFVSTGDHKTISSTPNLWVAWGRSTIYTARFAYNTGPSWTSPNTNTPPAVSSLSPNQPSNTAVYDTHGDRFVVAFPNGSSVRFAERSVDNSTQVQRDSPAHPDGVVRHCAISISSATSNVRAFAVGSSGGNTLYYVDYDRINDTWGSWTQVSASPIIGASENNYNVRRLNYGNGHNDLVIATGSGPYNLISTNTTAASAPKTPVITSPTNGTVADVNAGLTLTWTFQDDDPSDFQDAYSLRRSIGGGTFNYWNAGTSSWGTSDVFNLSGTTSVTLPSGWGADSDGTHSYSVKVRDQQGNASPNATNVAVTPSAKDNPTLTSPGASPTTAQITVSWTVATQTAYRIVLTVTATGVVVRDTGWVTSSSTSVLIPDTLTVQSYTVALTTRNDEGLTSNTVTQVFTPSYTPPQSATFGLTALNTTGVVRSSITNPDPFGAEALNASNKIYRRVVGDTGPGVLVATIPVSTPVNAVIAYRRSFEETDSSGFWGTANGGVSTATRVTTQAHSGVASYEQTAVGTGGFAGINIGPLNLIPSVPGDQWLLKFWVKGNSGYTVYGRVGWRTAANGPNNVPSQGPALVLNGSWQEYTMTSSAAPSNTAFAYPNLGYSTNTTVAGDKLYVDDVTFYKVGSTATPVTYDDFMVASEVNYEYSIVTTAINGAVTQSAWFS